MGMRLRGKDSDGDDAVPASASDKDADVVVDIPSVAASGAADITAAWMPELSVRLFWADHCREDSDISPATRPTVAATRTTETRAPRDMGRNITSFYFPFKSCKNPSLTECPMGKVLRHAHPFKSSVRRPL